MRWQDVLVLIGVATATAGAVTYFTPIKVFDTACAEFTSRLNNHEARLDGIDTAYLKKRLDELEAKYGHIKCYLMPKPDQDECIWLKDALSRFGGK